MKRLLSFCMLMGSLYLLPACKKDSSPKPATGDPKRPNSILVNWKHNGATWVRDGFMLLDLDHPENKDKSFMVIDIEAVAIGEYKFILKRGPLPIDSLASNWPPEVRYAAFGYSNDFFIGAHTRMQSQTATQPYTYRYDSLHRFSTGIYMYNYLNNPLWAGSMAGKQPQARLSSWVPDGADNAIPAEYILYFKESAFSIVSVPGYGGIMLTDLQDGVNVSSEFWKAVDAGITIEGSIYSHLYFDFDDWSYFAIYDWCPATYGAPCTKGGTQVIKKISMDNLMKWPAGWGKK